jgi:Protein of unknown function (DUF3301)
MELLDIFGLLLLAAAAWLWYDSLHVRETAVSAARSACQSEGLLLLDDTVSIRHVSLGRDDNGAARIRRAYGFEYTDTGNDRRSGHMVLLADRVLVIHLGPRNVLELRTLQ